MNQNNYLNDWQDLSQNLKQCKKGQRRHQENFDKIIKDEDISSNRIVTIIPFRISYNIQLILIFNKPSTKGNFVHLLFSQDKSRLTMMNQDIYNLKPCQ